MFILQQILFIDHFMNKSNQILLKLTFHCVCIQDYHSVKGSVTLTGCTLTGAEKESNTSTVIRSTTMLNKINTL